MAAPWDGFSAHDDRTLGACYAKEIVNGRAKARGLHIVRVSAETIVPPLCIVGILACSSSTTEIGRMRVGYSDSRERLCELGSVEVRIAPGCGKGAHIHQMRHAFPDQEPEKFLERSG